MNIRPTKTITVVDPREFDGDAYQVAQRAIQQVCALTGLLIQNMEPTNLMARNAELERLLSAGTSSDELREAATAWPESPQGRQFASMSEALAEVQARLLSLERAVAYDPKARVKA